MHRLFCWTLLAAFALGFAAGCTGTSPVPPANGPPPTGGLKSFATPPPPGQLPAPTNKK